MPVDVVSAQRVSTLSAVWTLAASAFAVSLGLADRSLALVAFGAVQLFDFAADVVLVIHFRGGDAVEHLERVVLRVVAVGLLATGTTAVAFSVVNLNGHREATASAAGAGLAVASVVVLTALAVRKRQIAVRLPSHALRADGNLTTVGAALAAVTVAGTSATSAFDLWWADPVAAAVIGGVAIVVGATTRP
jgi:divalent metal cation (Fe/Co/Zn/Cd) transporter